MEGLIVIIHVLASLGVIGLVLIQHGKGADAGAAFGGGNTGSMFSVPGSANFLSRATSICVTIFFCTSITLAVIASNKHGASAVADLPQETESIETIDTNAESDNSVGASDIPD